MLKSQWDSNSPNHPSYSLARILCPSHDLSNLSTYNNILWSAQQVSQILLTESTLCSLIPVFKILQRPLSIPHVHCKVCQIINIHWTVLFPSQTQTYLYIFTHWFQPFTPSYFISPTGIWKRWDCNAPIMVTIIHNNPNSSILYATISSSQHFNN